MKGPHSLHFDLHGGFPSLLIKEQRSTCVHDVMCAQLTHHLHLSQPQPQALTRNTAICLCPSPSPTTTGSPVTNSRPRAAHLSFSQSRKWWGEQEIMKVAGGL